MFIARAAILRWRDEADRLIDPVRWWMPLPEAPAAEAPAKHRPESTKRR
jgi:hypothetical protein